MAAPDDGTGGDGKGEEAALSERLRQLDARLGQKRSERQAAERGRSATGGMQGMGLAVRVSSEFAAGVLVGAALGWVVDYWAGTTPWGLIILLLLGFAAGVLNVLRALGKVAGPETRVRPGDGPRNGSGGDAGRG